MERRIWGNLEPHESESLFPETNHTAFRFYCSNQITKYLQEEKNQWCPVTTTGYTGTRQGFSTPCLLHVLPILVCPEDNCKE